MTLVIGQIKKGITLVTGLCLSTTTEATGARREGDNDLVLLATAEFWPLVLVPAALWDGTVADDGRDDDWSR